MQRLRLAAVVLIAAAAVVALANGVSAAAATGPRTVIAGAGLQHPVTLTPQDEVALYEPEVSYGVELAGPQILVAPPAGFAAGHVIDSQYWAWFAQRNGLPPLADEAMYDATLGVARVFSGPDSWWLRLDARRSELLGRYIALGAKGALSDEPTMMQVLRELRRSLVPIVIEVGGYPITPERWDARLIWAEIEQMSARSVVPEDFAASADFPAGATKRLLFATDRWEDDDVLHFNPLSMPAGDSVRIAFRFDDGREVAFHFLADSGYLVDLSRYEHGWSSAEPSVEGFESLPSFGVLIARIVATGGVPLADGADASVRLADPEWTFGAPDGGAMRSPSQPLQIGPRARLATPVAVEHPAAQTTTHYGTAAAFLLLGLLATVALAAVGGVAAARGRGR